MSSLNRKLDMKHGFMKSIIRNQVDRDNYDREIRAKVCDDENQGKVHSKSHDHSRKKPDARTYVPPFSRQNNDISQKETDVSDDTTVQLQKGEKPQREVLFLMEFEDCDGQLHRRRIYTTDNPDDIARRVGGERRLSPPYVRALAIRLSEEMEKRCGSGDAGQA